MKKLKMTISQIDNDTIATSNCTSFNDHYYVYGDVKTSPLTFDAYSYYFYKGEWIVQTIDDFEAYLADFGTNTPQVGDWYENVEGTLTFTKCNKNHDHLANARSDSRQ